MKSTMLLNAALFTFGGVIAALQRSMYLAAALFWFLACILFAMAYISHSRES